jgi:hypothetical protein
VMEPEFASSLGACLAGNPDIHSIPEGEEFRAMVRFL